MTTPATARSLSTGLPDSAAVLVVGAGPSGLSLALELGLHGVPTVVVESRESVIQGRPRAKTTSARTMELFRRWHVADDIRRAAPIPVEWSQRVTFCQTVLGPEITHFNGVFGLDLTDGSMTAEAGQQIPQPDLESVLRQRVAADDSTTVLYGWRVVRVQQSKTGVTVDIEGPNGLRHSVAAGWVVGADGPRSIVRSAMGARYEGESGGRPNVNITFRSATLAALIRHPRSLHYWVLNPDSPGVVGPLDLEGTWWAISTGTESIANDEEARAIIGQLLGGEPDIEIVATDPWQARMLIADHYRKGRLFLIGDAAHQNPPWGGHGFNTGVGDAMNLGWKLAAYIAGWGTEELLDSYGAERRPVAMRTIDVAADNMRNLSLDLAAAPGRADADHIKAVKVSEFLSLGLVLGYGYTRAAARQSVAVAEYVPRAEAGNRLPHRRLADGTSLFDRLGDDITVIGVGPDADRLVEAFRAQRVPLVHVADPAVCEPNEQSIIVVRPDQHIAWAGEHVADPDAIVGATVSGFGPVTDLG